jgi:ankyrin repeat protein
VTNLDFVELLLGAGADPKTQDHMGRTPLMFTTTDAPGAAKFLLNWPSTDANITTRSGTSFLARVRGLSTVYFNLAAYSDNPQRVHQHQFLLRQWREIEEIVVVKGAHDTGITEFE